MVFCVLYNKNRAENGTKLIQLFKLPNQDFLSACKSSHLHIEETSCAFGRPENFVIFWSYLYINKFRDGYVDRIYLLLVLIDRRVTDFAFQFYTNSIINRYGCIAIETILSLVADVLYIPL